jgi:regulator of protease activity HflC (stomatin/prohibitin superfamily)
MLLYVFYIFLTFLALLIFQGVKILWEYERGVHYRFRRYIGEKGAGINIIIPFVDDLRRIDTRTIVVDIPSQDVITRDNISIKVNAILSYHVYNASFAINKVEDYSYATNQKAQTTVRSVCGESDMDELLSNRDAISARIKKIVDEQTDAWGVKVVSVELKDIDLPQEMRRAMARQAEAERERRSKIIKAEGEFQASEKLLQAAQVMSANPQTLQLRYLETLRDISMEHNSTILFPMPIEILSAFKGLVNKEASSKEEK